MQRSPDIQTFLTQILQEDIGRGDITSMAIIPENAQLHAHVVARAPLMLSGIHLAAMLLAMVDDTLEMKSEAADGVFMPAGTVIMEIKGSARSILMVERTLLNVLQHLSGIATLTAQYVAAIDGLPVRIVDTRKTAPGLRELQKYAVRCGGGFNHRIGLDDGVLIKDNHIAVVGNIEGAVARARAAAPQLIKIEVECDTLDQVREAIAAKADMILLDNMDIPTLKAAVALCKASHIASEASGGITLENVRAVAETGVDSIAIGALTHSAPAVDIALDSFTPLREAA